jgi:hypothetical protein
MACSSAAVFFLCTVHQASSRAALFLNILVFFSMSTPLVSRYQYTDLNIDNREIRLLHSHPLDSSVSDEICCSISVASLKDDPKYWALSYCWGDPSNPSIIKLSNGELSITPNLHSALQEICKISGISSL